MAQEGRETLPTMPFSFAINQDVDHGSIIPEDIKGTYVEVTAKLGKTTRSSKRGSKETDWSLESKYEQQAEGRDLIPYEDLKNEVQAFEETIKNLECQPNLRVENEKYIKSSNHEKGNVSIKQMRLI